MQAGCDLSLMDEGNATVAGHCAFRGMSAQLVEVLAAAGPGGVVELRRGSKHYRALKKQLERQLQSLDLLELQQVAQAWGLETHESQNNAAGDDNTMSTTEDQRKKELVSVLLAASP